MESQELKEGVVRTTAQPMEVQADDVEAHDVDYDDKLAPQQGYDTSGLDDDEEEFVGCDSASASGDGSESDSGSSAVCDGGERSDAQGALLDDCCDVNDFACAICKSMMPLVRADKVLSCDGGCNKRLHKSLPPHKEDYFSDI